jgi:hypothetical protein
VTKTNIPPRHLSGCLGGAKSRPPVGTSVEDSTVGRVALDRRSSEPVSHRPTVEGYPTTGRAGLGFPTSGRITSPFTGQWRTTSHKAGNFEFELNKLHHIGLHSTQRTLTMLTGDVYNIQVIQIKLRIKLRIELSTAIIRQKNDSTIGKRPGG